MATISGIHHVTAVCDTAGQNITFYADLLGLRLELVAVEAEDVPWADGPVDPEYAISDLHSVIQRAEIEHDLPLILYRYPSLAKRSTASRIRSSLLA